MRLQGQEPCDRMIIAFFTSANTQDSHAIAMTFCPKISSTIIHSFGPLKPTFQSTISNKLDPTLGRGLMVVEVGICLGISTVMKEEMNEDVVQQINLFLLQDNSNPLA